MLAPCPDAAASPPAPAATATSPPPTARLTSSAAARAVFLPSRQLTFPATSTSGLPDSGSAGSHAREQYPWAQSGPAHNLTNSANLTAKARLETAQITPAAGSSNPAPRHVRTRAPLSCPPSSWRAECPDPGGEHLDRREQDAHAERRIRRGLRTCRQLRGVSGVAATMVPIQQIRHRPGLARVTVMLIEHSRSVLMERRRKIAR